MPKLVLLSSLSIVLFASLAGAAVPCETLSTLTLPNTTITMAQVVEAGKFVAPAATAGCCARGGDDADADGRAMRPMVRMPMAPRRRVAAAAVAVRRSTSTRIFPPSAASLRR